MRILTFDIEDWFHILDNPSTAQIQSWNRFETRVEQATDTLMEALDKRQQQATFFILGWIAEKYPNIVKRIVNAGHEIGSHSYAHQLVYQQSPDQFRQDVKRSIDILQALSGRPVEYFRAPGFSITTETPWAFEILIELGIRVDCSIFPAHRAHGGYEGMFGRPSLIKTQKGQLHELPINIGNIFGFKTAFSGGGYFRLLPYFFIRQLLMRTNYVMAYFHPRDFDRGQPLVEGLSLSRRFKSYVGISSALAKLDRMLKEFKFVDVQTAMGTINWLQAPCSQYHNKTRLYLPMPVEI